MGLRAQVVDVMFEVTSLSVEVERLIATARARNAVGGTRLANAWSVVVAHNDRAYADLLNAPGRTLPDGKPVAAVLRWALRNESARQVRGADLFRETLAAGRNAALRHYFVGTTPGTLQRLQDSVRTMYPGVAIAGVWAPPFAPVDDALIEEAIARVTEATPSVVWVGMGTPKQDFLAHAIAGRTGIPAVGVGAAFDFLAGTIREPHPVARRIGMEWAVRLAREPHRLSRRYVVGNTLFVLYVVQHVIAVRSDDAGTKMPEGRPEP